MKKGLNKKGQDLSIGTLILIVLGIVVLVLLILGFSLGWSNLWDKVNIFGGGASIADVVTRCNLEITSNNGFGYCQKFDKVKVSGQVEYVNCQDPRVEDQLDNKLSCGEARKTYFESAKLYCNQIGNTLGTKDVKINGLTCISSSVARCEELTGMGRNDVELKGRLSGNTGSGQSGQQLTDAINECRKIQDGEVTWKEILSGFQEAKKAKSGNSIVCCVPENYELGVIRNQ